MNVKKQRWWPPLLLLAVGAAALWPLRDQLTPEAIARLSQSGGLLAAGILLALYALKSLSVAFPLSALIAAGGLLFPLPGALAVNLTGVWLAQSVPFLLGRREQGGLGALTEKYPALSALGHPAHPGRAVFLLRLGGASPGDLISLYWGAAGIPWRTYGPAGILGSLPRVAATTILGSTLLQVGSGRFWLSLSAGLGLSALSVFLWLWLRKK